MKGVYPCHLLVMLPPEALHLISDLLTVSHNLLTQLGARATFKLRARYLTHSDRQLLASLTALGTFGRELLVAGLGVLSRLLEQLFYGQLSLFGHDCLNPCLIQLELLGHAPLAVDDH